MNVPHVAAILRCNTREYKAVRKILPADMILARQGKLLILSLPKVAVAPRGTAARKATAKKAARAKR